MLRAGITRASAAALLVVTVIAFVGATPAAAQEPTAVEPVPSCPVPVENVQTGLDVCVDRGEGSVYRAGEPITICVTANLPVIAIYPPPPPPTIQVLNSVNGGPEQLVLETAMHSGQQCITSTIVPPTGQETLRAVAIGDNGQITYSDQTHFWSTPAGF
ncbi:MAG: hypothetical protein AB7R89_18700 [Dehalococcoidia bacterium]